MASQGPRFGIASLRPGFTVLAILSVLAGFVLIRALAFRNSADAELEVRVTPSVSENHLEDGDGAEHLYLVQIGHAATFHEWTTRFTKRLNSTASLLVLWYDRRESSPTLAVTKEEGTRIRIISAPTDMRTTWTEGRNMLAKAAYAWELERGSGFGYWHLSDEDVILTYTNALAPALGGAAPYGDPFVAYEQLCTAAGAAMMLPHGIVRAHNANPPSAACTHRLTVRDEASLMQAAGAALPGRDGDGGPRGHVDTEWKTSLQPVAAFDACFNTMHRAAVPLLLPYVGDLDDFSWSLSQRILWSLLQCFPGNPSSAVVVNTDILMTRPVNQHSQYPRGRNRTAEDMAIAKNFAAAVAHGVIHVEAVPWDAGYAVCPDDANLANEEWPGDRWRLDPSFLVCLEANRPRWKALVVD